MHREWAQRMRERCRVGDRWETLEVFTNHCHRLLFSNAGKIGQSFSKRRGQILRYRCGCWQAEHGSVEREPVCRLAVQRLCSLVSPQDHNLRVRVNELHCRDSVGCRKQTERFCRAGYHFQCLLGTIAEPRVTGECMQAQ